MSACDASESLESIVSHYVGLSITRSKAMKSILPIEIGGLKSKREATQANSCSISNTFVILSSAKPSLGMSYEFY